MNPSSSSENNTAEGVFGNLSQLTIEELQSYIDGLQEKLNEAQTLLAQSN
jgi:hypothetical protein